MNRQLEGLAHGVGAKTPSSKNSGFALIIVVIFSVIILIAITSAAFFSALGTRSGVANERVAYQALLASESGIDTFPTRYRLANPKPTVTFPSPPQSGEATQAINLGDMGSFSVAGVQITLSAVAVTTSANNKFVRLTSTAQISSGNQTAARKVIVREFIAPTGAGASGNAPAAITSFNSISVNGNAAIAGYDTNQLFGTVRNPTGASVSGSGTSQTVRINFDYPSSATPRLGTGDAVDIGANRYKVTATGTSGNGNNAVNQVTLQPISKVDGSNISIANLGSVITSGQQIRRAPTFYATQALSVTVGTASSTLTLNDTTGLRVDQDKMVNGVLQTIAQRISFVDSGGITRTGRITAISGTNVTVVWEPTPPSSFTIAQGDRLDSTIPALLSKYNVGTGGSSYYTPSLVSNSSWFPSREQMFEMYFGMTKNQMQNSAGVSLINQTTTTLNKNLSAYSPNKIVYVQGDTTITGQPGLCGEGFIFIVDGDLNLNQSNDCFKGIIYVTGDLRFQGNPSILGAVVVEGDPPLGSSVDSDGDAIVLRGTQGSDFKVAYDPKFLSDLRSAIPTIPTFIPTSSWRQQ